MENQLMKKEIEFTADQVKLIKTQIAPKATDSELQLFLYQCRRTGLDPLTRQIYCIHRKQWDPITRQQVEKMTIQTSIDGFRVIAERSGNYAGQSEPLFTDDENSNPKICKLSVFKFAPNGQRYEAAVGVAYWNEYLQTDKDGNPMTMWKKMPHTMLSKVAEAVALRKAFPQDLSGLYTNDEMQQAANEEAAASQPVPKQQPAAEQNPAEVIPNIKMGESAGEIAMWQWKDELAKCINIKDMLTLYTQNRAVIDAWPELQIMFTDKKKELKKAKNQPAEPETITV